MRKLFYESLQRLGVSFQTSRGQRTLIILGALLMMPLIYSQLDWILNVSNDFLGNAALPVGVSFNDISFIFRLLYDPNVAIFTWIILGEIILACVAIRAFLISCITAGSQIALSGKKPKLSELSPAGFGYWMKIVYLEVIFSMIPIISIVIIYVVIIVAIENHLFDHDVSTIILYILYLTPLSLVGGLFILSQLFLSFSKRYMIFYGEGVRKSISKSLWLIQYRFLEVILNLFILSVGYLLMSIVLYVISFSPFTFYRIVYNTYFYLYPSESMVLIFLIFGVIVVVSVNLLGQAFLITLSEVFLTHLFESFREKEI